MQQNKAAAAAMQKKKLENKQRNFISSEKKNFGEAKNFRPLTSSRVSQKNLFFSSHVFVGKKERARVRVSCMIKEEEFLKKTRVAVAGRNARTHTHAHSEGYIRDFRARAREHALVCAHSRNASMLSLFPCLSLSLLIGVLYSAHRVKQRERESERERENCILAVQSKSSARFSVLCFDQFS